MFLVQIRRRQSIASHRKPFIPLRIAEPHILTQYPHNRIVCQASLIGKFQNLKSQNVLVKRFVTSLLENCVLAQKCRRQSIAFHRKPFIPLLIAEPHIVTVYPHNRIGCQPSLVGKFQNLKSQNKSLKWFATSLLENCF